MFIPQTHIQSKALKAFHSIAAEMYLSEELTFEPLTCCKQSDKDGEDNLSATSTGNRRMLPNDIQWLGFYTFPSPPRQLSYATTQA